jgi:hypothetical protein
VRWVSKSLLLLSCLCKYFLLVSPHDEMDISRELLRQTQP